MSVTIPTVFTIYPAQAASNAAIGAVDAASRIDADDIEAIAYNATHAYTHNPRTVLEHTRLATTDRLTGTNGTYTPILECAVVLGLGRVALNVHYKRSNCHLLVEVYESDGTTLDVSSSDVTASTEGVFSVTGITGLSRVIVVSARTASAGTWALGKIKITEVALTTSELP